jgi:hypothetical protein
MFPHEADGSHFRVDSSRSRATQLGKHCGFSLFPAVSASSTPAHNSASSRFAATRRLQRETFKMLAGLARL